MEHTRPRWSRRVVIVGGGLAGLTAARHLCRALQRDANGSVNDNKVHVTLVEAQAQLGGRIKATTTFCPGYPVDIGAEFIHCIDTVLTDAIERDYKLTASRDEWEEYFVAAHADGGPDEAPTRDGKYGMYYVDGKLLPYNSETLKPLEDALHDMQERRVTDPTVSVGQALSDYHLGPALMRLAVAGYGNTAGSTNLDRLSLRMLTKFEQHWETHETEGDYRLPKRLGMTSVIRAMEKELLDEKYSNMFQLQLSWPVSTVKEEQPTSSQDGYNDDESFRLRVQGPNGEEYLADAVIVTAPPPLLPEILPGLLSVSQRETLSHVGFETVCKVMIQFNGTKPPWPTHLHTIVCADGGPFPEVWFRTFDDDQHVMVGYLASQMADDFLARIRGNDHEARKREAARLGIRQLATLLLLDEAALHDRHVDTFVHAWDAETEPYAGGGGYMYPAVGLTSLAPLAEPCGSHERIFLAGEATNTEACCTMQAAMETGQRAAWQVLQALGRPISM